MTLVRKKDLLRSALRALRVRDTTTFNNKMALAAEVQLSDPEVQMLLGEAKARADLFKVEGVMTDYTRHLLASQEPQKALVFLSECRPAGLEDSPHLNAMQGRIEHGLRHMHSWEEYRAFYGMPIYYSTFDITEGTTRGRAAVQRIQAMADGGARGTRVLAIGPNDGLLERRILETLPESTLTVAEIASTFEDVLGNLQEEFPERVRRHAMGNFYDWAPRGEQFDLIIMFEVLEHLPYADTAAQALMRYCAPDGTVMVSVPVGYKYVEAQKADDAQYQHLRAYTEKTLRAELEPYFAAVDIVEGADRTYVATLGTPIALR